MLLSFDLKYWSLCQNLKDKEKKKEAITFLQKQINTEKEDQQQYYLSLNRSFKHSSRPFGWKKWTTSILV